MESVTLQASDYLLVRFCQSAHGLLRRVADVETWLLRSELAATTIDRPIYVTGLARSGTTLLLELLAGAGGIATHRYRDFPFLMTPYLWNRYVDLLPRASQRVERAHRDRIYITRESPEAMEEPLWRAYFPQLHAGDRSHRMTAADHDPVFAAFHADHVRKLLIIRQADRYLAKANGHVPRIEYLTHLYPDARFLIPIRHPLTHVDSLVRQHHLFTDYAQDTRIPRYLAAAGHFEFGPQRTPLRLSVEQSRRIEAAWGRSEDHRGYAIQWSEVYGFVQRLCQQQPQLAERMLVVRYEDLCASPATTLEHVIQHAELDETQAEFVRGQARTVSLSPHTPALSAEQRSAIWAETESVARQFGYTPERP